MTRVAAFSFHPAFTPPRSGGELRLYHLLRRVADSGSRVDLVSPTYGEHEKEEVQHTQHFREYRFPKTHRYNKWHHTFHRYGKFRECSGLVCSLACKGHAEMAQTAKRLAAKADILMHEYVFLVPMVPRRKRAGQLLVYDAHNVESLLARTMFANSWLGGLATRRIRSLEKHLVRECDLLFATSEEDMQQFERLYGADRSKMLLVPNGVDVEAIQPCSTLEQRMEARERLGLGQTRPACFFIGSFHPPNIEAAELIAQQVARRMPDVDFLLAGKVCQALDPSTVPDNVQVLGLISEEQKDDLFHGADVALNPMMSGSGTNLKMLEYMAAGLPILSTPVGARGLSIENRKQALIAKPENYTSALEDLLTDSTLRGTLAVEARTLAEESYSWTSIGQTVADVYTLKRGRRILILNDYPVLPAEQGGQVRIESVAKELAANGMAVTLLSLNRQDAARRTGHSPAIEELSIPRTRVHKFLDGVLSNIAGSGADDVSALLGTRWLTRAYGRALRREIRQANAVMLSHPFMEPLSRDLPKRVRLYYDSHNTEHDLKRKLYRDSRAARWMIDKVRAAERACTRRAEAVFCVSEENRLQLAELTPGLESKSWVAPNGVDCAGVRVRPQKERRAIRHEAGFGREFLAVFLGSGHPPNREAARLIIERVARDHPRVLFLLVGSVCGWFWNRHLPGNVVLMGIVSTPVKNFLLEVSDFALNPMLTGSGTSLKLFDYMAAGLPVLSTDVGARGLSPEQMEGVVLLEPDEFSRGLRALLADHARCEQLSSTARHIAEEHFDWHVALKDMVRVVARIDQPASASARTSPKHEHAPQ